MQTTRPAHAMDDSTALTKRPTTSGDDVDSPAVRALRAQLAGLVPPQIDAAVSGVRRWIADSTEAAFAVVHRSLSVFPLYVSLHSRVRALPIVEFYYYMWRVDPALFGQTMFANYALPLLMEAMPWYLSRRKISKLLRESRNSITHRLVANEAFSDSAIGQFILFSIVYALVQTVEQVIRTRVLVANRLLIKRLVLERILYSELGSLQERYLAVFGEEVRTDQLESHVFNDINETLNLFNNTLPSMMRGGYTLALSSYELYQNKEAFDVLAILRPSVVGLVSECVNWAREKYIVDAQTVMMQRNASEMSRVVSNIVDGLAEIQTNNIQQYQLRKLDGVSRAELSNQQGTHTFINSIYRQVSNRSVFDFASEVYVVRWVMQRRRINHETFRKVQNDIDYVTRLFGRMWSLGRDGVRVMDTQSRVIALLNLPSFIDEQQAEERRHAIIKPATPATIEVIPESKEEVPERIHDGAFTDAASASAAQVAAASSASAVAAPISASSAEFNFQTLLFRRCLFRYRPDLPLALNIHPRSADEPLPTDELDPLQPSYPRSTLPSDLMAEMAAVLAGAGSSTSVALSNLPDDSVLAPSSLASPHRHSSSSAVMDDMMESHDLSSSEDEGDETFASFTSTTLQRPAAAAVPSLEDPELRDLEDFVREQEQAGVPLRFCTPAPQRTASAASPKHAIDATQDEANALASLAPSPLHSRSPPAAAEPRCEPGTLLLERGKTYALIGQNRSGKSTLMQLLCKLYRPESTADCEIILNGSADFTAVPRMSLRRHLSYIAQRPFIFPGTLEDNIRIGNTTATAREVEEAARMAGIFQMEKPKPLSAAGAKVSLVDRSQSAIAVQLKPWEQNRLKNVLMLAGSWMYKQWIKLHGFDSEAAEDEATPPPLQQIAAAPASDDASGAPVSPSLADAVAAPPSSTAPIHPTLLLETAERGSNLSGGFAQSVALARVFLRKEAQIVILDEAMGQMDALKKREQIFPSLFRFVKEHNMTLILISHDVPLVCKLVDHVYVMSAGQVAQSGTHEELMRDETGVYARLVGNEE